MVKTTIKLEDELYRSLVKEALDKYGRTRSLSRLINEKLKAAEKMAGATDKDDEVLVERSFGSWRMKGTGAEYERNLRKESGKRFERLGI